MAVRKYDDPKSGRPIIEIDACARSTTFHSEALMVVRDYVDGALIIIADEKAAVDGALRILSAFGSQRIGVLPDMQIGHGSECQKTDQVMLQVIAKFGWHAVRKALRLRGAFSGER